MVQKENRQVYARTLFNCNGYYNNDMYALGIQSLGVDAACNKVRGLPLAPS